KSRLLRRLIWPLLAMPFAIFGAQYLDDGLTQPFGSVTNDGFSWNALVGTSPPSQCDTTVAADAPCEAHSATKSLRFNFAASAVGTGSESRQHINLPTGGMSEVWFEWYQLFPSAPVPWAHRDLATNDDNQFFALFSGPTGPDLQAWLVLAAPENVELRGTS